MKSSVKPPYLFPKDTLMASSSRWLPFWLRPERSVFLNNLLRRQNISDNPAQTDPLHEYNPVAGCIPTRTIKLYKHRSLQDLISLLCMWIEPVFCSEDYEGIIFSFASKACQLGDKNKEKSMKYIKLKSFRRATPKRQN